MKNKILTLFSVVAVVLTTAGCGSKKPLANQPTSDVSAATETSVPAEVTADANANREFVTVKDAADVLLGRKDLKAIAAQYGYKRLDGYAVYRLDSYDTMLYKNCQPAKKVSKGVYADTPKPLSKGTSSYVAVKEDVTVGVFNQKAYDNLVGQVKNGGFRLVEQGYEDHYTNGQVDVYCYAQRRTVRLSKAAAE